MALINKLGNIKLVNPEGTSIVLRDATGNYGETTYKKSETTEDEYTAILNDWGYGAPNPARDQMAVFIIGFIKRRAADVAVKFEPYSLFSATQFKAIAPEDGWYRFHLIGVPLIMDPESLLAGDAGYLLVENAIYQRGLDGLLSVVLPADLQGTKYCSAPQDQLFLANISLKKHEVIEYLNGLYKGDQLANRALITRAQQQHDVIRCIVTGSIYEFCRTNKYNAQDNVEYLNKYIIDIRYGVQ